MKANDTGKLRCTVGDAREEQARAEREMLAARESYRPFVQARGADSGMGTPAGVRQAARLWEGVRRATARRGDDRSWQVVVLRAGLFAGPALVLVVLLVGALVTVFRLLVGTG